MAGWRRCKLFQRGYSQPRLSCNDDTPASQGTYTFYFNHRGPYYSRCDGYTIRYEWTVTVNAPEGTVHEAFFDPITDGTAVAADSANGVLKPASFTDATGATAAIQRIAWEAGAVTLKLTSHTGIADHVVDFVAWTGRCRCR